MNEVLAKVATEAAQFILKHTGFFISSQEILDTLKKFIESITHAVK